MDTVRDIWTDLGAALRRFVGTRVNDRDAADDITQDVLLKVQSQLGDTPSDGKLSAWTLAVARNAIIDHYRARSVRHHVGLSDVEPLASEGDSERQGQASGLSQCLVRMVSHLPEPYREAVRLADIEGLGQQEIASRTGVSLSGAKSRVQRGRQQLREMIHDCCRIERHGRGNVLDFDATERSGRYCWDADGNPLCGR